MKIDVGLLVAAVATVVAVVTFTLTVYQERRLRKGSVKSAKELQALREKIVALETGDLEDFFSGTARKVSVPDKIGNYSLASVIGSESDAFKSRPLPKNLVFLDSGFLDSISTANTIGTFDDIRPTENFMQPYPNPAQERIIPSIVRRLKVGTQSIGLAGFEGGA